MSKEKLNLYQKLHKIQCAVSGLKKDTKGYGYQFVSSSKILHHIKPIMDKLGILLKQEVLSIENVRQDYLSSTGKTKNEILSKVMMKFTWIDVDSGEKDENSFGANGQNDWEKGLGSALTYAERYFLLKYFHIATDEDDIDNPNRKPSEKAESTPKPIVKQKLEPNTENWTKAVTALKLDASKMAGVKKYYELTEANEKQLINDSK